MSNGLYSGVSGLALGTGLYRNAASLWGNASGLDAGFGGAWTPAQLFASGQQGAWYDPSDFSTMFQDNLGITPVTATGQTVGRILDKSGRGNHATQVNAAARPQYQTAPNRLIIDKTDDALLATVPAGGFVGTMVLATPEGTAAYGVNIPAGSFSIANPTSALYFPGTAIVGQIIRNGAMSEADITESLAYLRANGGGLSYGAVTSFTSFWRGCNSLTSFPLINTAAGTNFSDAWRGCNSLTSFPLINTAAGTNFTRAWDSCTSLTSFPLINTAAGTNFSAAWRSCTSLTSFPANFFNGCAATSFVSAFTSTALNQASIDGILVSIATNGTSNGTFNQSGGSAPSATGNAAIDTLRGRGWTVTVTGGY